MYRSIAPSLPTPKCLQPEVAPIDLRQIEILSLDQIQGAAFSTQDPRVYPPLEPVEPAPRELPQEETNWTWAWISAYVLWLGGALATALITLRRTWRFGWLVRQAHPATAALCMRVGELAKQLGVRVPVVRTLVGLASPVVWAFWRPTLLWPADLELSSQAGQSGVLLHELAHLRRRDHWSRWLEMVAAVVHWWNPVFWIVRRQMRVQCELACDAWVTASLPQGRRAYAEALLLVCQAGRERPLSRPWASEARGGANSIRG